jgi:hydroxymethylglutaryl-CoA reductase
VPKEKKTRAPNPVTSRLPGFHALPHGMRARQIGRMFGLRAAELRTLRGEQPLSPTIADRMIENAVGTFALPLGVGLNMRVNGRDYVVPMAIEEPSVVAALSLAGKIVRSAGGFTAEADPPTMIAQVQIAGAGDPAVATERLLAAKDRILALAERLHPAMARRGGGTRDVEVRTVPAPGDALLVVHLLVDTQDAMGANVVNTIAEGVAPLLAEVTGGRTGLRIVSNLADRRLARAACRIPVAALADFGFAGETIAAGIVDASRFADADPYRAATHNKGVMNGIDAVAIATGQDWRAIEAGAHAYACRDGRYRPLSTWSLADAHLHGRIELPLALGTVGGPIRVHPGVQVALKVLRVRSARELATVFASVGLAQNLAAIRALASVGIQKGHMALHARCVAATTRRRRASS